MSIYNNTGLMEAILAGVKEFPGFGYETKNGLLDGTLTEYEDDRITQVGSYAFYGFTNLKAVHLKNIESVAVGAFQLSGITKATPENFPKVKTITGAAFRQCTSLTEADFPLVTGTTGDWYGCSELVSANFPKATTMGSFNLCRKLTNFNAPLLTMVSGNGLRGCSVLQRVDFQGSPTLNQYSMCDNPMLDTLILRGNTVATLMNINAFAATPIASGKGFVYVPDNLVDSYKTANNWSTYASQIKPISELEGET